MIFLTKKRGALVAPSGGFGQNTHI